MLPKHTYHKFPYEVLYKITWSSPVTPILTWASSFNHPAEHYTFDQWADLFSLFSKQVSYDISENYPFNRPAD